jgi:hypothetical protein
MKRIVIIALFTVGLSLAAIFSYYYGAFSERSIAQQGMIVPGDSISLQLPEDLGRANRELHRAQRALSRLIPSKSYIVIDRYANRLFLRTADSVLFEATCSTGYGGSLIDSTSGRRWVFDTPTGVFRIDSKLVNPWWRKPDWAFYEEDQDVPKDPRERFDSQMLGDYALGFGNGYFIHGTIYQRLLGISVTHGCVRLGSDDLKHLYDRVDIGTPVYIF